MHTFTQPLQKTVRPLFALLLDGFVVFIPVRAAAAVCVCVYFLLLLPVV